MNYNQEYEKMPDSIQESEKTLANMEQNVKNTKQYIQHERRIKLARYSQIHLSLI